MPATRLDAGRVTVRRMAITIREGNIQDAAAIARVHVQSWKSTYPGIVPASFLDTLHEGEQAEKWRQWFLTAPMMVLVAEDETGIFGFVNGGAIRGQVADYDAELYAIYLLQSAQRRGAGRSLTLAMAAALHRKGFRRMLVWVLEQNPAAGFYQRLGAVPVGRRMIELGGVELSELALGWPALDRLLTENGAAADSQPTS
jgi:ribosomal protein S18 acetylase RimI-like enzyme